MVLMIIVLGVVLVALFVGYMHLPKRNAATRNLTAPVFNPKTVQAPLPIARVRIPTLTDEVKQALVLHQLSSPDRKLTARAVYRILRQRGSKFDFRVSNIQSILDNESREGNIKRIRPKVGSPRQRRNGSAYKLAAA